MKKRLHYAMPRIPLHKLKMKGNNVDEPTDVQNKPETHVGTIAKIIWNAKLARRQAPGANVGNHDTPPQNVAKIGERLAKCGNPHRDKCNRTKIQNFIKMAHEMNIKDHVVVGLSKKEKKQIRKIISKLQKIHQNTHLETTYSSDSSDSIQPGSSESSLQRESGGSSSKCDTDEEIYNDEDLLSTIQSSLRCEVAANVHNVSCEDLMEGTMSRDEDSTPELDEVKVDVVADVHDNRATDQNEEAVGGVEEELESDASKKDLVLDEETELCGISKPGYSLESDSSFDGHHHNVPKAWKRWKTGKNKGRNNLEMAQVRNDTVLQVEGEYSINFQWGQEESSDPDSEGGWDFETGGMPLLPR